MRMGERVVLAPRMNETTARWWDAARAAAREAPPALTALLEGADRVDVAREEADDTFIWAIRLPGWTYPQPIEVVEPAPRSARDDQTIVETEPPSTDQADPAT
jgi:hypothetical protein